MQNFCSSFEINNVGIRHYRNIFLLLLIQLKCHRFTPSITTPLQGTWAKWNRIKKNRTITLWDMTAMIIKILSGPFLTTTHNFENQSRKMTSTLSHNNTQENRQHITATHYQSISFTLCSLCGVEDEVYKCLIERL